jgi:hypothetical protein
MRTALNLELEEEATNREEALHPAPPPLTDSQFRRFLNKVGSRIPGNCVPYCSTKVLIHHVWVSQLFIVFFRAKHIRVPVPCLHYLITYLIKAFILFESKPPAPFALPLGGV